MPRSAQRSTRSVRRCCGRQRSRRNDQQREERQRQHHVDRAHRRGVDPATRSPASAPTSAPTVIAKSAVPIPDDHRRARAEEQQRPQVLADIVGPQRELVRGWRKRCAGPFVGAVWRKPWREDGDEYERRKEHGTDWSRGCRARVGLVAAVAPPTRRRSARYPAAALRSSAVMRRRRGCVDRSRGYVRSAMRLATITVMVRSKTRPATAGSRVLAPRRTSVAPNRGRRRRFPRPLHR